MHKEEHDSPERPLESETAGTPPVEETPAQSVDNPDLPLEGDSEDFDEEPVPNEEFDDYADNNDTMDNKEELEEPNDLSGVDKEFDDEEG